MFRLTCGSETNRPPGRFLHARRTRAAGPPPRCPASAMAQGGAQPRRWDIAGAGIAGERRRAGRTQSAGRLSHADRATLARIAAPPMSRIRVPSPLRRAYATPDDEGTTRRNGMTAIRLTARLGLATVICAAL